MYMTATITFTQHYATLLQLCSHKAHTDHSAAPLPYYQGLNLSLVWKCSNADNAQCRPVCHSSIVAQNPWVKLWAAVYTAGIQVTSIVHPTFTLTHTLPLAFELRYAVAVLAIMALAVRSGHFVKLLAVVREDSRKSIVVEVLSVGKQVYSTCEIGFKNVWDILFVIIRKHWTTRFSVLSRLFCNTVTHSEFGCVLLKLQHLVSTIAGEESGKS